MLRCDTDNEKEIKYSAKGRIFDSDKTLVYDSMRTGNNSNVIASDSIDSKVEKIKIVGNNIRNIDKTVSNVNVNNKSDDLEFDKLTGDDIYVVRNSYINYGIK